MKDLIEALTIFAKYTDDKVIHCEHDVMLVCVLPSDVSLDDAVRLEELGFRSNGDHFYSYRWGSC